MYFVNFKIVRLMFYLFCLFFSLIPTVRTQVFMEGVVYLPEYTNNNGKMEFSCPSTNYSEKVVYNTFSSQIGAFIPIIGLLFTVTVYGTKSAFGYVTTGHLDDIIIFSFSLVPIFPWYTMVNLIFLIYSYTDQISKVPIKLLEKILAGSFVF